MTEAARGFSIVQRVSQVALAAGVCLMLHSQEAQGQAWNASQNPVFLNRQEAQVGIGTNVPQKSLHIREVQFASTVFPPEPGEPPVVPCSNGLPTLRLSPLNPGDSSPYREITVLNLLQIETIGILKGHQISLPFDTTIRKGYR